MNSVLSVAYLGDSVYELYIREYLLKKGIYDNGKIQKLSLYYVSAKSQRRIVEYLINQNVLTEEEIEILKKGRNAKGHHSKTSDVVTYRIATGLEYLFGTLYLEENNKRIKELINFITKRGLEGISKE